MKPLCVLSGGLLLNDWKNFVAEIRDGRRGMNASSNIAPPLTGWCFERSCCSWE